MRFAKFVLSVGCVVLMPGVAGAQEYRAFKSSKGVEIRARLGGVADGQATIIKEDGTKFTVPVAAFSAEDQKFIQDAGAAMASGFITKASANDNLPVEELNALVGAPIFGETVLWETVLWESDAESVATKLALRAESKTKTQSSYRSYPKEDFRLFGARPYSVALYAEGGKPVQFSMVFANKGDFFGAAGSAEQHFDKKATPKDALAKLAEAMKKDIDDVTAVLSKKMGEPVKQRFGEGEGRRTVGVSVGLEGTLDFAVGGGGGVCGDRGGDAGVCGCGGQGGAAEGCGDSGAGGGECAAA